MKNKELYQRTVDILVAAYFNDTLAHNDCAACAVGNIVAANLGVCVVEGRDGYWKWKGKKIYRNGYSTNWFPAVVNNQTPSNRQKKEIAVTGYSIHDLTKIESAFEGARTGKSDDEYMFNGLMAVIEVLDQIHENTDTEVTTNSKKRFDKVTSNLAPCLRVGRGD